MPTDDEMVLLWLPKREAEHICNELKHTISLRGHGYQSASNRWNRKIVNDIREKIHGVNPMTKKG